MLIHLILTSINCSSINFLVNKRGQFSEVYLEKYFFLHFFQTASKLKPIGVKRIPLDLCTKPLLYSSKQNYEGIMSCNETTITEIYWNLSAFCIYATSLL